MLKGFLDFHPCGCIVFILVYVVVGHFIVFLLKVIIWLIYWFLSIYNIKVIWKKSYIFILVVINFSSSDVVFHSYQTFLYSKPTFMFL